MQRGSSDAIVGIIVWLILWAVIIRMMVMG